MKVFLSWSRPQSHAVAEEFNQWLRRVIQSCRDNFLSSDVEKGDPWFGDISEALDSAKLGIVFVTRENMEAPWLNFEAGALRTRFDKRLCPVLVDMTKADYTGPLANLQLTEFRDKDDMFKLMKTINRETGDLKLEDDVLEDAFERAWPELLKRVEERLGELGTAPSAPVRGIDDKVDEILELVRETRIRDVTAIEAERERRTKELMAIKRRQEKRVSDADLGRKGQRNQIDEHSASDPMGRRNDLNIDLSAYVSPGDVNLSGELDARSLALVQELESRKAIEGKYPHVVMEDGDSARVIKVSDGRLLVRYGRADIARTVSVSKVAAVL